MSEPVIVELQSAPFAFIELKSSLADMPRVIGQGFGTLAGMFGKAGAAMAGNPMAHYLAFDAQSVTFELGFPVLESDTAKLLAAGLSIGRTPGGRNMTDTHVGPYSTVSETYAAMEEAMKALGVTGSKDMWESYLSPPETPPAEIRTDVIWPLVAAGARKSGGRS
jgi:effector-binding domain-containing protein